MHVSDRSLFFLMGLALVVVVGSIATIMIRVGPSFNQIVGFATTATGSVNVSINDVTSFSLNISVVNFSSGFIDDISLNTSLNTSDIEGANPNTFLNPAPFEIQNDGNRFLSITVNGSTAPSFIGAGAGFYFRGNTSNAACQTANLSILKTSFNESKRNLCQQLNWTSPTDRLNVTILIDIPQTSTTGAKLATVEFNATAVTPAA